MAAPRSVPVARRGGATGPTDRFRRRTADEPQEIEAPCWSSVVPRWSVNAPIEPSPGGRNAASGNRRCRPGTQAAGNLSDPGRALVELPRLGPSFRRACRNAVSSPGGRWFSTSSWSRVARPADDPHHRLRSSLGRSARSRIEMGDFTSSCRFRIVQTVHGTQRRWLDLGRVRNAIFEQPPGELSELHR